MKRKITEYLIKWKKNPLKLPLVIKGARQVGKTYAIREFAKENYAPSRYIEIDFEKDPNMESFFEGSKDYSSIMSRISKSISFKSIDFRDDSNQPILLFLDEIQKCPNAITALKFLAEAREKCHVIASGSLLGLYLSDKVSYPVGYVEHLTMFPFDFEEFMWAMGYSEQYVNGLIALVFDDNLSTKIDKVTHQELSDLFHKYIVIGGLPAAINTFLSTKTYPEVMKTLKNLYDSYIIDMQKYTKPTGDKVKVIECFESIPNQLKQQNKKFKYSLVDKKARSREYIGVIEWLLLAGLVLKCENLKTLNEPIETYIDKEYFKLFFFDTGILLSIMNQDDYYAILNGTQNNEIGGIYENAVATILNQYYYGKSLMYYRKDDLLEVDFVIRNRKVVIPVEVKSGNNLSSASLSKVSANKKVVCLRVSNRLVAENDIIKNMPFYMFALMCRNRQYR